MILTPDQRLRVFVSATLHELGDERAVVRRTIERLRLAPVMLELAARPHPPRSLYRAYVDQSHIFVGLYWRSYGWLADGMTVSGLEDEYRLAGAKPKLIYVKDPGDDRDPRLAALLSEIATQGDTSYRHFSTPQELADLVADDLAMILTEHFTAPAEPPEERDIAPASHLPVSTTSFIGRDREVADVEALLREGEVRLVTLTGAGGIGKSRLALEVADRVRDAFPGGVHFVPLAQVSEPALVIPTIGHRLGIRSEDEHVDRSGLVEALRDRTMLLVLDNFEQVVAAAPEIALLLERCPNLKALVTSRRVLHVRGEHQYAVGRLGVPDDDVLDEHDLDDAAAARLFVERARAVSPQLRVTPAEAKAIAQLVRRLDGVPLAIELAAARSRLLPPSMLLQRISDSLDLLDGALADLPERQRSVRATLDWSFRLLTTAEQALFARLSTFVGSFSLEAAEAVCATDGSGMETLDALSSLVENSLVLIDGHDAAEPRFRLLNPVREYARVHLESSRGDDVRDIDQRHAAYYMQLCEAASADLRTARQAHWLDVLERESGNLGVAARRLVDAGELAAIAETTWNVWPWLWLRSHMTEARYWLSVPLAHADTLPPQTRARLVWLVGSCMFEQGDYDDARTLLDDAAELFAGVGDSHGRALADLMRGSLAAGDGHVERATELYASSVSALHVAQDHFSAAVVGSSFGLHTAMNLGDSAGADRLLADALADAQAIANEPMIRMATLYQGFARLVGGDVPTAEDHIRHVVVAAADGLTDELLSYALDGLGALSLARGDAARAATLMGAAAGLRERRGLSSWPLTRSLLATLAEAVKAQLTQQDFDIAWAAGHTLDVRAARRFALDGAEASSTAPAEQRARSST